MKASELSSKDLMVGDWLMFNDKPCQVKGLHNDDTATFVGHKSLYYLIDAEPIPLTPEILEKNGFNDAPFAAGERVRFVVLCEEYRINYYFNINWFSIYKNVAVNDSDYPVFICAFEERIKYIHELQHALRLCKIEKEIVV